MGSWTYECWTEEVELIDAPPGVRFVSVFLRKDRYIPDWQRNPDTGVWEQVPGDIKPIE